MKKSDVVIIGAGLFGSMTARYFRMRGLSAYVIDSKDIMAASKCSFGVWKDTWVNAVIHGEAQNGTELLQKIAGIEEIDVYNLNKSCVDKFKRADCSKILLDFDRDDDVEMGVVERIEARTVFYRTSKGEKSITARKAVIVAAGSWTPNVLALARDVDPETVPRLDNLYGAVLNISSRHLDGHKIKDWAPYRQSVLLQDTATNYVFGDGATVKNPKMDDERVLRLQKRCIDHLKDITGDKKFTVQDIKEGFRPYLQKGSPSFINQHSEYLWSATGGAKNSTILCGHIALQLHYEIQG